MEFQEKLRSVIFDVSRYSDETLREGQYLNPNEAQAAINELMDQAIRKSEKYTKTGYIFDGDRLREFLGINKEEEKSDAPKDTI